MNQEAIDPAALMACPECDAVQTLRSGAAGTADVGAVCFRCGARLLRRSGEQLSRAPALTLAAFPLFIAAHCFPLLRLEGAGSSIDATLLGAVRALVGQNRHGLALLVLLLATILPGLWLAGVGYLLLALRRPPGRWRNATVLGLVFQWLEILKPWTQLEILLLGLVVAFAKLAGVFNMVPGVALPCLVGFLLLARLAGAALEPRRYWQRLAATESGGAR